MAGQYLKIKDGVEDRIRQYPIRELMSALFPGIKVPSRGLMRSPFHEDRHPSFSLFKSGGGIPMWKDFSTGESGDNIALFRKVYGNMTYREVIDQMSLMLFNEPGVEESSEYVRKTLERKAVRRPVSVSLEPERESVLKVISVVPLSDPSVPEELRDYWRSRAISDDIIGRFCQFVVFENQNRKGLILIDSKSCLPMVDADGNELKDDGRSAAIGMMNDLGGFVLRVPETSEHRGFKGATSSFISTVLADGTKPVQSVSVFGEGPCSIDFLRPDPGTGALYFNSTQCFVGIRPEALQFSCVFLQDWVGRQLDARDVRCLCAVLSGLNAPVVSKAVLVEGMFDGLSDQELTSMMHFSSPDHDLVILNSVGNVKWAVPFLARHRMVISMLDNDLQSGAGQKAYGTLCAELNSFNRRTGSHTVVYNGMAQYKGFKDLNDVLVDSRKKSVKSSRKGGISI